MLVAIPLLLLPFQATAQPKLDVTPSPSPAPIIDINHLAPLAKAPDFDTEVLAPLHKAQAEAAAQEAARAAQAAEDARQAAQAAKVAQAAAQAVRQVQAATTYGNNYTPGQCTAYVAARVGVPASMGNATNWESGLLGAGWHYGLQAGSIGVSHNGWAGHVVYVESVTAGVITISEMNAVGPFVIDTRVAGANEFVWLTR